MHLPNADSPAQALEADRRSDLDQPEVEVSQVQDPEEVLQRPVAGAAEAFGCQLHGRWGQEEATGTGERDWKLRAGDEVYIRAFFFVPDTTN